MTPVDAPNVGSADSNNLDKAVAEPQIEELDHVMEPPAVLLQEGSELNIISHPTGDLDTLALSTAISSHVAVLA